ncbi:hypothetical protein BJY04DRAFT_179391 [Aspergillus karnatakaensis]|uniref:uncharacterized protein n=1 Tax=Aspergillus karnatakaensis TaxID=1810916 RepID=UPI003CCCC716
MMSSSTAIRPLLHSLHCNITDLPLLLERAVSHTPRSDPSTLSRPQIIGLVGGLTIFILILGFGTLLWILSHFPRAQKRFCDICCTFACPCVKKRLEEFDYMEMDFASETLH